MTNKPNIPDGLYKAIERVMDEHSAWIARPSRASTEAVARAAMNYYSQRSKRERMAVVMDGCIAEMQRIRDEEPT